MRQSDSAPPEVLASTQQPLSDAVRHSLRALFGPSGHRDASVVFGISTPPDWSRVEQGLWVHFAPDGVRLAEQGWKIHVSAVESTSHQTLAVVSQIAFEMAVPFKHLRDLAKFRSSNTKYAVRASAGKFIALYADEQQLETLLTRLERRLRGLPGPYVLSDVRFGDAPVFVRYGAFRELRSVNDAGAEVLCIRDPNGTMIEDAREPRFVLPDFASVPDVLRAIVDERLHPSDANVSDLLEGYTIERPLHFSNGGGVYLLRRDSDGGHVIMKEGRANAGWDFRGNDAFNRIHHEFATLSALHHSGLVPTPIGVRTMQDHAFLFEEFVEGVDLHSWVARNFPYSFEFDCLTYADRALRVARSLVDAVGRIHELGFAVMDIQPSNVIVTPLDGVRLIDLESVCPLAGTDADTYTGTPGFVPYGPHTPRDRDAYALAQTVIAMFYPLTSLSSISETVIDSLIARIRSFFPDTVGSFVESLSGQGPERTERSVVVARERVRGQEHGRRELRRSLIDGVQLVRRPHLRHASPYPVAHEGLPGTVDLAISSGLAGVMLAVGPEDVNAAADLELLARGAERLPISTPGLLEGVLGIALVLASRGEHERARAIWHRERQSTISSRNISLRTGLAGRLIGLLGLSTLLDDRAIKADVLKTLEALVTAITDPPPAIVSAGSRTNAPMGLMDGWAGPAIALCAAADELGDVDLYRVARRALGLDLRSTCTAPDGSLQAEDGSRMLPYLEDGSAGMGIALTAIPAQYREAADAELLQRIALACRARACVSAGLYRGRMGLVVALSRLDVQEIGGMPIAQVIEEQLQLIEPFLFTLPERDELFVAGDRNTQLAVDLASGSAGLAHGLQVMSGHRDLFGIPASRPRTFGVGVGSLWGEALTHGTE